MRELLHHAASLEYALKLVKTNHLDLLVGTPSSSSFTEDWRFARSGSQLSELCIAYRKGGCSSNRFPVVAVKIPELSDEINVALETLKQAREKALSDAYRSYQEDPAFKRAKNPLLLLCCKANALYTPDHTGRVICGYKGLSLVDYQVIDVAIYMQFLAWEDSQKVQEKGQKEKNLIVA